MTDFFTRFTDPTWASSGQVSQPSDVQIAEGFAFLGSQTPTVELHNWNFQILDAKDKWLYGQLSTAAAEAALPMSETDITTLQQLLDLKTSLSVFSAAMKTTIVGAGSTVTVVVPAGLTVFNLFGCAGGGGGSNCLATGSSVGSTDVSGGGGGSGAAGWWQIAVVGGDSIVIEVGKGGTAQTAGGATIISKNNAQILALNGGSGADFSSSAAGISAGAQGGTIVQSTAANVFYSALPVMGGWGSDGQSTILTGFGNGAPGPLGGGGRAGNQGGKNALAPGAGGGGAYDNIFTGTMFPGGTGGDGVAFYSITP